MGDLRQIFREKSIRAISTPEELTGYIRVTNSGIWMLLIALLLLVSGFIVWSFAGRIDSVYTGTAEVQDGIVTIHAVGSSAERITAGMPLSTGGSEGVVTRVETDGYGRLTVTSEMDIPDGIYEAKITVGSIAPISFLLE